MSKHEQQYYPPTHFGVKKTMSINTLQFEALANAGAVKEVVVRGTHGGFVIYVDGKLIEAKRGHPRVFIKMNTVTSFLNTRGIKKWNVDVSDLSFNKNEDDREI